MVDADHSWYVCISKAMGDHSWLFASADVDRLEPDALRCPSCGLYLEGRRYITPILLDIEWLAGELPVLGFDGGNGILFSPEAWRCLCELSSVPLEAESITVTSVSRMRFSGGRDRLPRKHPVYATLSQYVYYIPPMTASFIDDKASGVVRRASTACDWCGGGSIQRMKSKIVVRRPAHDSTVIFRPRNGGPYPMVPSEFVERLGSNERLGIKAIPVKCLPAE